MRPRHAAFGIATVLAVGCNVVAGFPDYTLVDAPATGGGGTTATATVSGTVSQTMGAGGVGGVGGAGGSAQPCNAANACARPLVCKDDVCQALGTWADQRGGNGNQLALDVAVSDTGELLVGGVDGVLARATIYDPQRALLFESDWSAADDSPKFMHDVAWSGTTALTYTNLSGGITIGTSFTANGTDILLAALNINGTVSSVKLWGDDQSDTTTDVASTSTATYVLGQQNGGIDFGGGHTVGDNGSFLLKHDAVGMAAWAESLGGAIGTAVATDSQGAAMVIGFTALAVTIANTQVGPGTFFVKLDATGDLVWHNTIPTANSNVPKIYEVETTPDDDFVVVGNTQGSHDFGGVDVVGPANAFGPFMARIDGSDGSVAWAQAFGGDALTSASAFVDVAVDPSGTILAVGSFNSELDLGGGALTSEGEDVLVAAFDGIGNHLYSQGFGDLSDQFGYAAAYDPVADAFVIAGAFVGTLDVGAPTVPVSTTGQDWFVAQLRP